MARDGKVPVWEGIWLSSAVLLPLGVFLTYKAAGDSAEFKIDGISKLFRRLFGREMPRALVLKEVHMTDVNPAEAIAMAQAFLAQELEEQNDAAAVDALEVLKMATVNGSKAMNVSSHHASSYIFSTAALI